MIKVECPQRKTDAQGSGAFGSSRGSRTHNGVDYACYPGSAVLSPVDGVVTKLAYPYADDLFYRYVEVTAPDGTHHRVFYIDPTVTMNLKVKAGVTQLGVSQELKYDGITQHVHYEIKDTPTTFVNPEDYPFA